MEFLKQILSLTWLVSLIAFIVYWRKKVGAKKSAGEKYKDDENYKNVSRTKRIIGLVCIASFAILFAINSNSNVGSSSSSSYTVSLNSSNSNSSSSKQVQETSPNYAEADIDILLNDVKSNAAKANKNYKGKYVKIVGGVVRNIESNARYINVEGSNPYEILINVQCYPKNNSVKDAIMNLSKGQQVTVYGKITDVGEIMGYSLDLEKIE